jgi:hypothetical protein
MLVPIILGWLRCWNVRCEAPGSVSMTSPGLSRRHQETSAHRTRSARIPDLTLLLAVAEQALLDLEELRSHRRRAGGTSLPRSTRQGRPPPEDGRERDSEPGCRNGYADVLLREHAAGIGSKCVAPEGSPAGRGGLPAVRDRGDYSSRIPFSTWKIPSPEDPLLCPGGRGGAPTPLPGGSQAGFSATHRPGSSQVCPVFALSHVPPYGFTKPLRLKP